MKTDQRILEELALRDEQNRIESITLVDIIGVGFDVAVYDQGKSYVIHLDPVIKESLKRGPSQLGASAHRMIRQLHLVAQACGYKSPDLFYYLDDVHKLKEIQTHFNNHFDEWPVNGEQVDHSRSNQFIIQWSEYYSEMFQMIYDREANFKKQVASIFQNSGIERANDILERNNGHLEYLFHKKYEEVSRELCVGYSYIDHVSYLKPVA